MCGIAGANFNWNYDYSLSNRGKDAQGKYKDDYVTLFHHRLAIIDLSFSANQPFRYKDYILIFNGEVYNYKELKKELKEYNFYTSSDTEVLLYAYDKWGKKFLNKLNGDFSFCIYNKKTKRLFCARDRVGNKPFYYYYKDKKFVFASEIKALRSFIKDFNIQKLGDAILFSINDNDEFTIYENIYNLPPSHYLEFDILENRLTIHKWYHFEPYFIKNPFEEFEWLIEDAINIRLRSDVDIGIMLSGGLDSSLIAYYAPHKKFFSVTFPGMKIDESKYVNILKEKLNLQVKFLTPSFDKNELDNLIFAQWDIFRSLSLYNQYFIFKNADVKVMLSGQGADELFGGYYHHISRFIAKNEKEFINRVKLYKSAALEEIKIGKKFLLPKDLKEELFREDNIDNINKLKDIIKGYTPNFDLLLRKYGDLKKSMEEEVFSLNLPQLLRYEDRNAMAFSIENRTPFTDYRIIEFGLSLPLSEKFKNGYSKFFLRKFLENKLPKEIVYRLDKVGFEAPDKMWFGKDLVDFRVYIFNRLKDRVWK